MLVPRALSCSSSGGRVGEGLRNEAEHTAHNPLIRCDEGPALEISAFESFYGLRSYVLSTWLVKPNFVCLTTFGIGESHSLLFMRLAFLD